jgi:TfoX/Sxy family transcriptional regulator of competence genes
MPLKAASNELSVRDDFASNKLIFAKQYTPVTARASKFAQRECKIPRDYRETTKFLRHHDLCFKWVEHAVKQSTMESAQVIVSAYAP